MQLIIDGEPALMPEHYTQFPEAFLRISKGFPEGWTLSGRVLLRPREASCCKLPDARVNRRPCKNLDVAIVGQNLLDDHHPEFAPRATQAQSAELQRNFYSKINYRF